MLWELSYANVQMLLASIPEIDWDDDETATPEDAPQSIEDFVGLANGLFKR